MLLVSGIGVAEAAKSCLSEDATRLRAEERPALAERKNAMPRKVNLSFGDLEADQALAAVLEKPSIKNQIAFAKTARKYLARMGVDTELGCSESGCILTIRPAQGSLKGKSWMVRMATALQDSEKGRVPVELALDTETLLSGKAFAYFDSRHKRLVIPWWDMLSSEAGPTTQHEIRHYLSVQKRWAQVADHLQQGAAVAREDARLELTLSDGRKVNGRVAKVSPTGLVTFFTWEGRLHLLSPEEFQAASPRSTLIPGRVEAPSRGFPSSDGRALPDIMIRTGKTERHSFASNGPAKHYQYHAIHEIDASGQSVRGAIAGARRALAESADPAPAYALAKRYLDYASKSADKIREFLRVDRQVLRSAKRQLASKNGAKKIEYLTGKGFDTGMRADHLIRLADGTEIELYSHQVRNGKTPGAGPLTVDEIQDFLSESLAKIDAHEKSFRELKARMMTISPEWNKEQMNKYLLELYKRAQGQEGVE